MALSRTVLTRIVKCARVRVGAVSKAAAAAAAGAVGSDSSSSAAAASSEAAAAAAGAARPPEAAAAAAVTAVAAPESAAAASSEVAAASEAAAAASSACTAERLHDRVVQPTTKSYVVLPILSAPYTWFLHLRVHWVGSVCAKKCVYLRFTPSGGRCGQNHVHGYR